MLRARGETSASGAPPSRRAEPSPALPDDNDAGMSLYERQRQKTIKENDQVLVDMGLKDPPAAEKQQRKRRKLTSTETDREPPMLAFRVEASAMCEASLPASVYGLGLIRDRYVAVSE